MLSKLYSVFIRRLTERIIRKILRVSIPTMDSPFFRSRLNAPSRPRYCSPGVRPVPVQNQTVHPPRAVSRAPKVVTIPVHFVEPERDRSGSALKIQKVFRGFLVRKSVRKIAALRREVEEIERKVLDPEAVEMMRRDSREKLRVSEMLMNVLFRLDSVRGVDSGVRDFRKTVIRRAITLQEKVDEIVAVSFETQTAADADRGVDAEGQPDGGREVVEEEVVAQADDSGAGEPIPSSLEVEGLADGGFEVKKEVAQVDDSEGGEPIPSSLKVERPADGGLKVKEEVALVNDSGEAERIPSSPGAARVVMDDTQQLEGTEADVEYSGDADQKMNGSAGDVEHLDGGDCDETMIDDQAGGGEVEMFGENDERVEENCHLNANEYVEIGAGDGPIPLTSECLGEAQLESQSDSTSNPQSLIEVIEENTFSKDNGLKEEEEEEEEEEHGCDSRKKGEDGGGDRTRRNKELLEKMLEDNEKMMGMMAELFERNERQTRLLSTLSQRVEQLERALVCGKLRKKKKRHASGCPADCSETSPCLKKSGRK